MLSRILFPLLLLTQISLAGIIQDVRLSIAQNNFPAADAQLRVYMTQRGVDPEYLEALSWMARGALAAQQLDQAEGYAKQTETRTLEYIRTRKLDSDPHLGIALGAALEVEALTLARRGRKEDGVALLRRALTRHGNTSIHARLQKNLNILSLTGKPAPPLEFREHLGPKPTALGQLKGSPVLLFFWAHWCGDCKAEAPIIARLRAEYAGKGLAVMGPTQLYGYAARGEEAPPQQELAYIESVRQRYYAALSDMPAPVSKANFDTYGASTTPTIVLIDRAGRVALYHPGTISYDELRTAIDSVMKP